MTLAYMCFLVLHAVVIDAYPNTATMEQGTTLILVCRVVGVSSTTGLSYQWTCPGGCDAGAVDPEWAARIQQGNILVVNVHNGSDNGTYTCNVVGGDSPEKMETASHTLTVTRELCICTMHVVSTAAVFVVNSLCCNQGIAYSSTMDLNPGNIQILIFLRVFREILMYCCVLSLYVFLEHANVLIHA